MDASPINFSNTVRFQLIPKQVYITHPPVQCGLAHKVTVNGNFKQIHGIQFESELELDSHFTPLLLLYPD